VGALAVAMLLTTGLTLWAASGQTADAAVVNAVASAVNDRTADMNLSGSVTAGPLTFFLSGTGSMDFTQSEMQTQINERFDGNGTTVNAVYLDKVIYLELGDEVGQVLPGKSWLSLNLSQLSAGSGASSPLGLGASSLPDDPVAVLKLLGQDGNSAIDLGPSTVNGVAVEGYSVKVNAAAIRARIAAKTLPSWAQQALATVTNPDIAYKVFIDQAGNLVRQTTTFSLSVASQSVSGVESIDFSNYGAPVTITVPPANEVASLQQFLQATISLVPSESSTAT
jgi:hypothetical protein